MSRGAFTLVWLAGLTVLLAFASLMVGRVATPLSALFDPANPENTWKVTGIGFTLPTGITLQPRQFLVISATEPAAFRVSYNVPAAVTSLPEGASPANLPPGAREGRNDGGGIGYSGPCPPIGRHRYFHKLFALDTLLPDLPAGARKADLERAMKGHVLASAELVGTYLERVPEEYQPEPPAPFAGSVAR